MEFKGLLCVLVLGTLHEAICQPYFHHFPSPRQGKFARKLDHYEIVIPKAVDKRGTFLSHVVRNHTNVQNFKHVPSENDLHYELLAFGRVFQLQLISNVEFLSPGFVIESGNLIQTRHGKELREFLNCHYVGRVKNATNSWLAISTCNGLNKLRRNNEAKMWEEKEQIEYENSVS